MSNFIWTEIIVQNDEIYVVEKNSVSETHSLKKCHIFDCHTKITSSPPEYSSRTTVELAPPMFYPVLLVQISVKGCQGIWLVFQETNQSLDSCAHLWVSPTSESHWPFVGFRPSFVTRCGNFLALEIELHFVQFDISQKCVSNSWAKQRKSVPWRWLYSW